MRKLLLTLIFLLCSCDQSCAQWHINTAHTCGDGYVNALETCDDGNTTPGDGCSAICVIEVLFDVDFSDGSLVPDTYADNTVTYTRAGNATQEVWNAGCTTAILSTVTANNPQFDCWCDIYGTLHCGILLETALTNIYTYSYNIENAVWIRNNLATISTDGTTDPFGTSLADGLVASGVSNNNHSISRSNGYIPTFYISTYAKAGDKPWLAIIDTSSNSQVWADLTTCTVGYIQASAAGVFSVGNGWCKIWSFNVEGGYRSTVNIYSATANQAKTFAGDNVTVNTWLFGVNRSNSSTDYPTSSIIGAASGGTRSASTLSTHISNAPTTRGTIEADILCRNSNMMGNSSVVQISDGTANDVISVSLVASGDLTSCTITAGGLSRFSATNKVDVVVGVEQKLRCMWSSDRAEYRINNLPIGFSELSAFPTTTRFDIGVNASGVSQLSQCIIKRITTWHLPATQAAP